VVGGYTLAGELAEARGDTTVAYPAYEAAMADYVARSREFARRTARQLVPGTRAGVRALTHGTALVTRLPRGLGRRLVTLARGDLGLHETVEVGRYPALGEPAPR
jgi:hypothetical protein